MYTVILKVVTVKTRIDGKSYFIWQWNMMSSTAKQQSKIMYMYLLTAHVLFKISDCARLAITPLRNDQVWSSIDTIVKEISQLTFLISKHLQEGNYMRVKHDRH